MNQSCMIVFLTISLKCMATSFFHSEEIEVSSGERKIFYVKGTLIIKRLNDFETNISETISLELTISNKEWFIMFAYNPLIKSNKLTIFNEGSNTLNKAVNKFDNILVTDDLNI